MKTNNTKDFTDICASEFLGRISYAYQLTSIVFLCFGILINVVGISLWVHYYPKVIALQKRGFAKIAFVSISWISILVTGPLTRSSVAYVLMPFSCVTTRTTFLLSTPLFVSGQLVQVIQFRNNFKLYNYIAKQTFLENSINTNVEELLEKKLYAASDEYITKRALLLILMIFTGALGITASMCPELGLVEKCVVLETSDVRVTLFLLLFAIIGLCVVTYIKTKLKKHPDPFELLSEIKESFLLGTIFGIAAIFISAFSPGKPEDSEVVNFNYGVLFDVTFFILMVHAIHYQIYKALRSKSINPAFLELSLQNVLEDDRVGKELFRQHLIAEFSVENLDFIEAVAAIKAEVSPKIRHKYKWHVFERFFRDKLMLNISHGATQAIIEAFSNDSDLAISDNVFDNAYNEVWLLLEMDSFRRFQSTTEYSGYAGIQQKSLI